MPEIGEIRRAREIGYKGKSIMKWQACPDCGKERWVEASRYESRTCRNCSAKRGTLAIKEKGILAGNRFNWKGGRHKNPQGYVLVWVSRDDFFRSMASKDGYIPEHRLVMAQHLGRCLLPWELVHHKGIRFTGRENRSDNLIDNLQLLPARNKHNTMLEKALNKQANLIKELQARVTLLEAEIVRLNEPYIAVRTR